jgi:hypothetical protein
MPPVLTPASIDDLGGGGSILPGTVTATGSLTAADAAADLATQAELDAVAGVKDYADSSRSSDSIAAASANWANLDTALDLTLTAAAGDVIMCGLATRTSAEAVELHIDVVTVVSGSPVNSFGLRTSAPTGSTLEGIWYAQASVFANINGGSTLTLGAGDVSGGNVVLRLRYRTASGGTRTVVATSAARPLVFYAVNLGPLV